MRAKNIKKRILSVCLITALLLGGSGIYAKFLSSGSGQDAARIARWGVEIYANDTSMFSKNYASDTVSYTDGDTVVSQTEDNIVAPGTKGQSPGFTLAGCPETALRIENKVNLDMQGWNITYKNASKFYCPLKFTLKLNEPPEGYEKEPVEILGTDYTDKEALQEALDEGIDTFSVNLPVNTELSERSELIPEISWEWAFDCTEEENDQNILLTDPKKHSSLTVTQTVSIFQIGFKDNSIEYLPIGGRIFYDAGTNDATYHFYDENYEEIEYTYETVGYTNAKEYLADAKYYTVEGTPTKDRFYVVDKSDHTNGSFTASSGLVSKCCWGYSGIVIDNESTLGKTQSGLGNGKLNTQKILSVEDTSSYATNSVFTYLKLCNNAKLGGNNDWYIGTREEYKQLYNSGLGAASSSYYIWTSEEYNSGWGTYITTKAYQQYGANSYSSNKTSAQASDYAQLLRSF